jgi:hypothetical protein
MHVTPDEFIDTAERLIAAASNEADQRSAVSRAYYGALHASRTCIPAPYAPTQAQIKSSESHKQIIDSLATWGKAAAPGRGGAQQASRALARLKRERRAADYDIHLPLDMNAVTSCIASSRKIVSLVRDGRALYDKQQSPKQA